ncbi:MAG: Mov34/MPN/PAD-1 family protein [Deltaproteobacteria bacterium]|nr:Mov34/MPN/PAD-1 family protein [Deltaproteobacteria bacterium]
MFLFGRALPRELFDAVVVHAELEYPKEACGILAGPRSSPELTEVFRVPNVQDELHSRDPALHPASSRSAFRMDDRARLDLARRLDDRGLAERVVYHSHTDTGAYFSPDDRAGAVRDGIDLLGGVVHLVVSVRAGRLADAAAFRYDAKAKRFEEQRVLPSDELPDLAVRAMDPPTVARPIPPVGQRLVRRAIALDEEENLDRLAAGRAVRLSEKDAELVELLGRGLLSPIHGFLRAAEVAAVDSQGHLLDGTPWRAPLVLTVGDVRGLENGDVVGLDFKGAVIGWLAVQEAREGCLAGPVFVRPERERARPDAADLRADIIRRGCARVLALPERWFERRSGVDLSSFDTLLASEIPDGFSPARWLPLPKSTGSVWLDAVVAQNAGATHIWLEDPIAALSVRESLRIVPWPSRAVSVARGPL